MTNLNSSVTPHSDVKLKKWGFDGGSAAGCRWRASGMWRPNKSLKLAPRSLLPVDRSFIIFLMCIICFFPVAATTFWFYCASSDRKCVKFLFSKWNKSLFSNIVVALKESLSSFKAHSENLGHSHSSLFSMLLWYRRSPELSTMVSVLQLDSKQPQQIMILLLARLFWLQ